MQTPAPELLKDERFRDADGRLREPPDVTKARENAAVLETELAFHRAIVRLREMPEMREYIEHLGKLEQQYLAQIRTCPPEYFQRVQGGLELASHLHRLHTESQSAIERKTKRLSGLRQRLDDFAEFARMQEGQTDGGVQ